MWETLKQVVADTENIERNHRGKIDGKSNCDLTGKRRLSCDSPSP